MPNGLADHRLVEENVHERDHDQRNDERDELLTADGQAGEIDRAGECEVLHRAVLAAEEHQRAVGQHHADGEGDEALRKAGAAQGLGDDRPVDDAAEAEHQKSDDRHANDRVKAEIGVGVEGDEHTEHHKLALRKAQDAHNAPDERDAHRDHGVDGAVDDALP